MGHSKVSITQDLYAHMTPTLRQRTAEAMDQIQPFIGTAVLARVLATLAQSHPQQQPTSGGLDELAEIGCRAKPVDDRLAIRTWLPVHLSPPCAWLFSIVTGQEPDAAISFGFAAFGHLRS